MEAIQQARRLFLKCHQHQASLTDTDKHHLGRDIRRFITIAIKEATSKDLFENHCVLDILKSALKQRACENSDVMPVARAFQILEKYFLLLVEQPWKSEFKEIKMYGGFYRTRVKSVLPDCESVFEHAGYMVLPETCSMIFRGPLNKTFLLLLAFDCRVSQVECETIADHYNKVKGLSMSLTDAISNILHDEYSRETPAWGSHLNKVNGMVNLPPGSNFIIPPALPKREPIVNSINTLQNGRCEPGNGVYGDHILNTAHNKFETGIAFRTKSPIPASENFYSTVLSRPPLTPSGGMPESLTYIDAPTDEILPELPQGTSEDHMWESLKLLHLQETQRQQATDNWKQSRSCNDSKGVVGPNHTNIITPTAYFPANGLTTGGITAQSHIKPAPSIDEGIELDLPNSRQYSHSTKFPSIRAPQVMHKHTASFQQPSFDQGYRTVNPESMYNQSCPSGMHNTQHTIYHAPAIVTDGPGLHTKTSVSCGPPPIPSRALKPKVVKDEDCVRSKMHMSAPHFTSSQPLGVPSIQNEVILNRPPVSAPGYFTNPHMYETETILRKIAMGKSNSLKTGQLITPLSPQATMTRTARSMDISLTPWECQSCTTLNMASNTICLSCSHSRRGPDISQPVIGETKKSCATCTFENHPDKSHCEMCGSKLHDKFTFV